MSDIGKGPLDGSPEGYPGDYPPPPPPYSAPPDYGPGGYGPTSSYPGAYGYPQSRGTNGLAIASLVVSCASIITCQLLGIAGAIMGHVARKQIKESGEEGDGLALGGIIVGWIVAGLAILFILLYVLFIAGLIFTTASLDPSYS